MYAAAAEPRDLSRRIQPRHRLAIRPKRLTRQISLDPTQRLAREDVEAHGNEGSSSGIEELVRFGDTHEAVPTIATRASYRRELHILGEWIVQLTVSRDDLTFHLGEVQ